MVLKILKYFLNLKKSRKKEKKGKTITPSPVLFAKVTVFVEFSRYSGHPQIKLLVLRINNAILYAYYKLDTLKDF